MRKTKRLNIGCNSDLRKGWINIDTYSPVLKRDAKKLRYTGNSIDEIFAGNLLEHLTNENAEKALREWYRVLKSKGKLDVRVPDLIGISKDMIEGVDRKESLKEIYGSQSREGQFHWSGWYEEKLRDILDKVGFVELETIGGPWKNDLVIICYKP